MNPMIFLALTVLSALVFGYLLFRIYHILLTLFLSKMEWSLDDLKSYHVTPTMQMWDKVIQSVILVGIIYKVLYT